MNPYPSVSIVMATYNGERFLREQLASLSAQTQPPVELVVGDDGSTDRTLELLEEFRAAAPFPVRIHRHPTRLGYAENFFTTATRAQGDLLAFCDQDDVWAPTKLERCVAAFAEHDIVMAIHNAVVVDENLHPRGDRKPNFPRNEIRPRQGGALRFELPGLAMVADARLVREIEWRQRACDEMQATHAVMAHDLWMLFLAYNGGDTALLAEPLAFYRQHGTNTCGALPAGAKPRVTLERRSNQEAYSLRARASAKYRDILTALASKAPSRWHAPFSASANEYARQAEIYAHRAKLYSGSAGFLDRCSAYIRLLGRRAYHPGSLGRKAWLKDTCALVLVR